MMEDCLACLHLKKCQEVTARHIAVGSGCPRCEEVHEREFAGRFRFLQEFGPWALLPNANPRKQRNEHMNANRGTLRQLAGKLGILKLSPTNINMKHEDLLKLIEPTYPEIASMSEEDVRAIIDEITAGGGDAAAAPAETPKPAGPKAPAAPKPAGPKPAGPKPMAGAKSVSVPSDEVPAEKGDEPAAPAAPKPAGPKPAGAGPKPAGPKPAGAATAAKEPSAPSAGVDIKPILDRLDFLGEKADKQDKILAAIAKENVELKKILNALAMQATWAYNEAQSEENQIASVVDWVE